MTIFENFLILSHEVQLKQPSSANGNHRVMASINTPTNVKLNLQTSNKYVEMYGVQWSLGEHAITLAKKNKERILRAVVERNSGGGVVGFNLEMKDSKVELVIISWEKEMMLIKNGE